MDGLQYRSYRKEFRNFAREISPVILIRSIIFRMLLEMSQLCRLHPVDMRCRPRIF